MDPSVHSLLAEAFESALAKQKGWNGSFVQRIALHAALRRGRLRRRHPSGALSVAWRLTGNVADQTYTLIKKQPWYGENVAKSLIPGEAITYALP